MQPIALDCSERAAVVPASALVSLLDWYCSEEAAWVVARLAVVALAKSSVAPAAGDVKDVAAAAAAGIGDVVVAAAAALDSLPALPATAAVELTSLDIAPAGPPSFDWAEHYRRHLDSADQKCCHCLAA